jgi:acetyltransferase-like isoleucine patch superfamily enzyme/coenzyme F420-reducing hydrogenase beta subunit
MIKIKDKKDCCGCNACGDICTQKAIVFKTDVEGFWYPEIDEEKCTNCGLCEKVCPIINVKELKKNDFEKPQCYAAKHKNLEVVFDSTSGGLFTALAEKTYEAGGYVGGAIFDENFLVKHFISNEKSDLLKIRNSKYLQSDLCGFFRDTKKYLKTGKQVLVCGCPCQMAALRVFLSVNYDNLIIVDFICKGNGSPKAWRKYLDSYEERYGSPVIYAKAKSKEYGWRNLTQKVILANGKWYYENRAESNYTIGYNVKNVLCRPSCYTCQFKGFPRIADITVGDFWRIEKIRKDNDLGTSIVMINSQKGITYFEKIRSEIDCFETPIENILSGNLHLTKSLAASPDINRGNFYKDLDEMNFTDISEKYHFKTKKIGQKARIKNILKAGYEILKITRFHPAPIFQLIKYNHYLKCIASLSCRNIFIPARYCILEISKGANMFIKGRFVLGYKRIKGSKLETRLLIEKGATLETGDNVNIAYGADIEIFENAKLTFGGNNNTNTNLTIVCAEQINIGEHVSIGRNVTIRDNNGGHYLNRKNYRNTRPVIIGNKAWLTEGCTIMPGVHIGEGAIIGAHAFVVTDVPAHSMVIGNPARVIDKDILWKE